MYTSGTIGISSTCPNKAIIANTEALPATQLSQYLFRVQYEYKILVKDTTCPVWKHYIYIWRYVNVYNDFDTDPKISKIDKTP